MFQQISITGYLGADPELRQTNESGIDVCNFNVATNESWIEENGQRQTRTTWFRVTTWNGQARACANYLKKGSRVQVIGKMREPTVYVGRDGRHRANLNLTAGPAGIIFLDPSDRGQQQQQQASPPTNGTGPSQETRKEESPPSPPDEGWTRGEEKDTAPF